uniref:Uncharacterized protein n=2 Tax=Ciona intestinalis TaxID=7719 RepID=F6PIN4_CIOIN
MEPEVLKLPTKQREELYTDIARSEVSKKDVNPIAKKNVVFTEKENSSDTTSVPDIGTQSHNLGFMYGYRNAALQCLLHISTKLLASFKTEKAPVPKVRDLWMLSLDNCQKRRKFNNQWQSERISEKENLIVASTNTEHALPSADIVSASRSSTYTMNEESMRAFFNMEHALTPIKTPLYYETSER